MFRSIVVAFAAFLMLGQARDRGPVEPSSERDSASRPDARADADWMASRRKPYRQHGPVSEL